MNRLVRLSQHLSKSKVLLSNFSKRLVNHFEFASYDIPHPDKIQKGGEDAFHA